MSAKTCTVQAPSSSRTLGAPTRELLDSEPVPESPLRIDVATLAAGVEGPAALQFELSDARAPGMADGSVCAERRGGKARGELTRATWEGDTGPAVRRRNPRGVGCSRGAKLRRVGTRGGDSLSRR